MRLSVIFTTYNQPAWLEKVLWGFEAQTFRDFEIVIADDGSDAPTNVVFIAATLRESLFNCMSLSNTNLTKNVQQIHIVEFN
jgi:glycosyltransferase involved in cell wall biosynthesis